MAEDRPAAPLAEFEETLVTAVESIGVALTASERERLGRHYLHLIEANRTLNLTRITDPREAAAKHYADSLAVLAALTEMGVTVRRVLDVGTGAGFPAIPLAVARPGWKVTAIDATGKKARAAQAAGEHIALTNLTARHARCEDICAGETYGLVCIRAVAALEACVQMGARLVAGDGALVCWKAAEIADDEMRGAVRAARSAGLSPPRCFPYEIAGLDRPRRHQLVWFRRG